MIFLDEEIVEEYCVSICNLPQSQCPLCPLRKVQDATEYKHRDGMAVNKAIKKAEVNANIARRFVQKQYDGEERYKLPADV